jgi:1,4-dihydroxy-2-naphthoate octaprenyltransferase
MNAKAVFQTMRPPFLILTPVCVFAGMSTAVADHADLEPHLLILALLGALLAHIAVNTLNEYFDFQSGLDLSTVRTPFSGGSGALPQHPEARSAVFVVGVAATAATFFIGLFFLWEQGPGIVPIGLAGLLLVFTYTHWINRQPYLCLIAPGAGFGFLMVVGTQYVLQGSFTLLPWLVAAIPFFLVNNLLLLNQYPDIQADAKFGRNHFPIAYGIEMSNRVYGLFALAAVAVMLVAVASGYFPPLSLIALLPMPLAFYAYSGAVKYGQQIGSAPQYLGANVAVAIITPLLLGISLVLGG